ncbi:uncharacterized protein LOC105834539 [Monomorium pharaonis]|uniref:uncharacterized protein LOC105834539 n=1 Tax=Monomorium pharaonis TaxID=307658 RepID=UPI00174650D4|nr:uncharacterized protein LOC105834539 [Monomorium pharaonis]
MGRVLIAVLLCSSFKIVAGQTTTPNCTEMGAFEIYDGTCRNYYFCVDDGEELKPVILSCASSAIFDPDEGRCMPADATKCLQTTTMAPLTTSAPLCLGYGRFPINDVYCKRYYLCYWNGSGYSKMDNLSCPNKLVFNPTSGKCVSSQLYKCPGT